MKIQIITKISRKYKKKGRKWVRISSFITLKGVYSELEALTDTARKSDIEYNGDGTATQKIQEIKEGIAELQTLSAEYSKAEYLSKELVNASSFWGSCPIIVGQHKSPLEGNFPKNFIDCHLHLQSQSERRSSTNRIHWNN